MDEKSRVQKYDPNTEAFQMRAQWKKAEICFQQWRTRWSWLLQERNNVLEECNKIRAQCNQELAKPSTEIVSKINLKPVPQTTTGFVGWIAAKPECQLEIYSGWMTKIPIRAPDVWHNPDYLVPGQSLKSTHDKT